VSAARRWWHRLRDTFGTRAERELDQEFQSHLQMQIDDHVRAGMTPSAARRAALIAAGGLEGAKERCATTVGCAG
jgi:hypothetical protein